MPFWNHYKTGDKKVSGAYETFSFA